MNTGRATVLFHLGVARRTADHSGSPSASVQGTVVRVHAPSLPQPVHLHTIGAWSFADMSSITGSPLSTPGGAFARGHEGGLWLHDGTNGSRGAASFRLTLLPRCVMSLQKNDVRCTRRRKLPLARGTLRGDLHAPRCGHLIAPMFASALPRRRVPRRRNRDAAVESAAQMVPVPDIARRACSDAVRAFLEPSQGLHRDRRGISIHRPLEDVRQIHSTAPAILRHRRRDSAAARLMPGATVKACPRNPSAPFRCVRANQERVL